MLGRFVQNAVMALAHERNSQWPMDTLADQIPEERVNVG
jgi:hypothetical protein